MYSLTILSSLCALALSASAQQLTITAPGADFWWISGDVNMLQWTCRTSPYSMYTVTVSNPNTTLLPSGPLTLYSDEPNSDCSKLVPPELVVGTGYVVSFSNPANTAQMYAQSDPFEVKAFGSTYPVVQTNTSLQTNTSSTSTSSSAASNSSMTLSSSMIVQASAMSGSATDSGSMSSMTASTPSMPSGSPMPFGSPMPSGFTTMIQSTVLPTMSGMSGMSGTSPAASTGTGKPNGASAIRRVDTVPAALALALVGGIMACL